MAFSLYGRDPKYIRGMDRNIALRGRYFPGWEIMIFHDDSVEPAVLEDYERQGILLRNVSACGLHAASWRFLVHDEACDRFIVRDSDSRLGPRELEAVLEWQRSGRALHIMRDHPHHRHAIMGGMWGMRVDRSLVMRDEILRHQGGRVSGHDRDSWWMKDQQFLRDVIYPRYANPCDSMIHHAMDIASRISWPAEPWAVDFPTPIGPSMRFVGEVFTYDAEGAEVRGCQVRLR